MQANVEQRLIELIMPLIGPMGYEVVHVEVVTHRQKTLRLYIDFACGAGTVGIEDCVKVTRALDEHLDQSTEVEAIFRGAYELEVSSPGVDRPLRQRKDYERFAGHSVRLHTFRPLSSEEMGNAAYFAHHQKTKNFSGVLRGLDGDRVLLAVEESATEILIPFSLIAKGNLEPSWDGILKD